MFSHKVVKYLDDQHFDLGKSLCRKLSNTKLNKGVNTENCCVNFSKLFGCEKNEKEIIKGIENKNLIHSCAALYSTRIGVDHKTIYSCLENEKAWTILLVLEKEHAKSICFENLKKKFGNTKQKEEVEESEGDDDDDYEDEEEEEEETSCDDSDSDDDEDKFDGVFSDCDDSSDEDEDEEKEKTEKSLFANDVKDFVAEVKERKKKLKEFYKLNREKNLCASDLPSELIGMEQRLVASATFESSDDLTPEKILVLTLISTRKMFECMGVGRRLIKYLGNPSVAGFSDVIVVNAASDAVKFFKSQGFTDDLLLNDRYKEIHNSWVDITRMCRFSNYGGRHVIKGEDEDQNHSSMTSFEVAEMESDLISFQKSSWQAYRDFTVSMFRMKSEILRLNRHLCNKDEEILRLKKELAEKDRKLRDAQMTLITGKIASLKFDEDVKKMSQLSTSGADRLPSIGIVRERRQHQRRLHEEKQKIPEVIQSSLSSSLDLTLNHLRKMKRMSKRTELLMLLFFTIICFYFFYLKFLYDNKDQPYLSFNYFPVFFL